MLKQANAYYCGQPERCVNDLWRIILNPLSDVLTSCSTDLSFDESMYVSTRLRESVSEEDILNYTRAPGGKLLLVKGRAGVGKTTFLCHVVRKHLSDGTLVGVWANMLELLGLQESQEALTLLQRHIGADLDRLIAKSGTSEREWDAFFLTHCTDETGVARHILKEMDKEAPGSWWLPHFLSLKEKTDVFEHIRLRIRYLRERLGKAPVIVIDNVDQLPAGIIQQIIRFAASLARGQHSSAVILAARPVSLGDSQKSTGFCNVEVVEPPDIRELFRKRLDRFLSEWDKRIIRGRILTDSRGRKYDLSALSPGMQDAVSNNSVKLLIEHMASFMTSPASPYGELGPLVYQMLNYHTRLALIVTAHYVATGHIDLAALLKGLSRGESPGNILSWRKALGAILLGVRSIYESDKSWPWNIWNDGMGDRVGVMIQARTLRLVHGQRGGLTRNVIIHTLASIFGYETERIESTLEALLVRGLLDECADWHYCVSDAGLAYLRHMLREFEYLQHVAVDVPVDEPFLVKCTTRDEPADIRFTRVLKLAQWLRELEVSELAHVLEERALGTYSRFYQDDTISGAMASTLLEALKFLPRTAGPKAWEPLEAEARHFASTASYAHLLADADQFARTPAPVV